MIANLNVDSEALDADSNVTNGLRQGCTIHVAPTLQPIFIQLRKIGAICVKMMVLQLCITWMDVYWAPDQMLSVGLFGMNCSLLMA